jgi:hypothetical protein
VRMLRPRRVERAFEQRRAQGLRIGAGTRIHCSHWEEIQIRLRGRQQAETRILTASQSLPEARNGGGGGRP